MMEQMLNTVLVATFCLPFEGIAFLVFFHLARSICLLVSLGLSLSLSLPPRPSALSLFLSLARALSCVLTWSYLVASILLTSLPPSYLPRCLHLPVSLYESMSVSMSLCHRVSVSLSFPPTYMHPLDPALLTHTHTQGWTGWRDESCFVLVPNTASRSSCRA